MADTTGNAPKQFHVLKDNGEWWITTFGGRNGVRWERADPPVDYGIPDMAYRNADSIPTDNQRAQEWAEFFAGILIEALEEVLEEAKPHIEDWLRNQLLPWAQTAAKRAWNRVKEQSTHLIYAVARSRARITVFAPSGAIALSEGADEDTQAQAHRLNLTPEEAQKQLEDIRRLTRVLAERVRALTNTVAREDDESEERLLQRRAEAEQIAVRNVAANVQVMLEQGADLDQAIALSATYTPVFIAGRVEASSSIRELAPVQRRNELGMYSKSLRP
ncbi:hypothetical protein [Arthrobacter crystallopoietes]|uniref:Uncharacterized protein n=1 Tax=Crystallibacter crystallopoietes TaxID=37928 RepID=A0A1H1CTK5_9MICC|nr:hypothetical protein [Arthrobacter crystallopoietes]AUI50607.1 hypothetical protein AC20117_06970 [Arthrobacter crystallopoietes]SDQ67627.1 hypothetical protein SAMN04489742_2086 [Arthrobacter crystallopoietes]